MSQSSLDWSCSATIFDVPKSHVHCTFENFTWPSEGIRKATGDFLAKRLEGISGNLILIGSPGLGKTHLAVALYKWGVKHLGGTGRCSFIPVPQFIDRVKKTFDKGDGEVPPNPFLELESISSLVVLDDLLGRKYSAWEMENVIFPLISTLHSTGAGFVVTTNYSLEQMNAILQPHEMSRLLTSAVVLLFTGKDRRPSL